MPLSPGVRVTVVLVPLVLGAVWVLSMALPISSGKRPAARETICTVHLREIGLALSRYDDDNGRLPPLCVSDANGTPMHSWRVLLLKYLDKDLYDLVDLGESWNGPNNSKLHGKMPPVYGCPNAPGNKRLESTFTNYLALVAPNSALQKDKSKSMSEIFIGTILIAEVAESGIHWMEPRDLDVTDLDAQSTDSLRQKISSNDPHGPAVILGDLRIVRFVGAIRRDGGVDR
jgi:hypothetical protein